MKKKLLLIEACSLFFCLIFCSLNLYAVQDNIPKKINVQGKLTTSSGQPITGSGKTVILYILDNQGTEKAKITDTNVSFDSDGIYNVIFDITGEDLDFNNQYSFKVEANGVTSDPTPFSTSPNAFYASSSTYALVLSTSSDVKLVDGNFNLNTTYNIKVASANYLADTTGTNGQIWGINNLGNQGWVSPGSLSISSATKTTIGGLMLGDVTGLIMTSSGVLKINNGASLTIPSSGSNKNKIDINFGNIDQSNTNKAVTGKAIYTALSAKVSSNSAITGATKTKITYDSKGLVTSGEDLTASDIPDLSSTYATQTQLSTKVSSNSAITGATKTKITYDNKGLVTKGENLTASDIPDLSSTYATQTQLSTKVSSNSAITGATKTKITYDNKGLVTKGEDLTASDIPDLSSTYATQTQLSTKVSSNSAITGATKTKITYDNKGLVTAGGDLTASDIPDLSSTYATQTQLSTKVSSNSAITGATKTKITYDNKGLVTKGEDLTADDIPSLSSAKISSMTGYAKATTASEIKTTDSLNEAIGKLEKALDGKQDTLSGDLPSGNTPTKVWATDGTNQGWVSLAGNSGNNGQVINGADLAEMYQSTEKLVPGDVVSIDTTRDNAIVKTKVAEDPLVAGVISTEPGLLMNQNEKGYKLALVGKVPTKVCNEGGAIKRGDLLVSASIPGYAKKAGDNPKVGTVIGKALENLDSQKGTILVLVNLQ